MRRGRDRRVLLSGAAAALVAVAGGLVYEKTNDRHRMLARAAAIAGGDPERGETQFIAHGCGGCHTLEHVPKAVGRVGPGLESVARQAVIAGRLANTPENMVLWIRDPQRVSPGAAMPDLGVTERDARDISSFLYARPD